MRTPLSVATRGRITDVARGTVALATIGWIVLGALPIHVISNEYNIAENKLGSSQKLKQRLKAIEVDDNELLSIVYYTLKKTII
jgi:hypothetical protein